MMLCLVQPKLIDGADFEVCVRCSARDALYYVSTRLTDDPSDACTICGRFPGARPELDRSEVAPKLITHKVSVAAPGLPRAGIPS